MAVSPEWLTLGATVLGLGVSVLLHRSSLAVVRAGDLRRARSAALTVLPAVRDASRSLSFASEMLAHGRHPDQIGTDDNGETYGVYTLIRDYKTLEAHISTLAQLESAAAACHRAFAAMQKMSEDLDTYIHPHLDPDDWIYVGDRWPASRVLIDRASALMISAVSALETELGRPD